MKVFSDNVKFCYPWRSYQKRVLDELEVHLDDNHLHIVAAPGSGKTVLGLEVVRQLGKPVVIFAPTLAIRDQWVDRFVSMFCGGDKNAHDWISRDISSPKLLTVSTYQGLHSVTTGQYEPVETDDVSDGEQAPMQKAVQVGELAEILKTAKVRTIVVDEAHHLRKEWWRCLIALKKALGKPVVVALTATPPYDVTPAEWEKYKDLCGPVDSEIAVPELVGAENLCPHQDYVYVSAPATREQKRLDEFHAKAEQVVDRITVNADFIRLLQNHPCVSRPQANVSSVAADAQFYTSIAVFLTASTGRPPRRLLRALGIRERNCPKVDLGWMEILLNGCVYSHYESFDMKSQPIVDAVVDELKSIGAVEKRKIYLRSNDDMSKLLARSISKLDSIEQIVEIEAKALGDKLRMVVLTDFIRKEVLPNKPDELKELNKIGVAPIFEKIRRSNNGKVKLGILCGTLVLIPAESVELMEQIASELGIETGSIRTKPLAGDQRYVTVKLVGREKEKTVKLITALFSRGGITVMVGTKSLLGEGWDAPCINSLVLASFVGSYMLSNQMRGRAIRSQRGVEDKTSNVWHLLCIEAGSKQAGGDFETLTRRFKSFEGPSFTEDVIENGLDRLAMGTPPFTKGRLAELNEQMTERACDRAAMAQNWKSILAQADEGLVERLEVPAGATPRRFVRQRAIVHLAVQAVIWTVVLVLLVFRLIYNKAGDSFAADAVTVTAAVFVILSVVLLGKGFVKLWRFFLHRNPGTSLRQLGRVLLEAMSDEELITTNLRDISIRSIYDEDAQVASCYLEGGTTYENSLFLEMLAEIVAPVQDPRYLLGVKDILRRKWADDFYSIPKELGKKKAQASRFTELWEKRICPAELIYTKRSEHKPTLLKAKGMHLAEGRTRSIERIRSWT